VIRRKIAECLANEDVDGILMEDESTWPGEESDLGAKFHRILDSQRLDAIVVYWPKGAKMQATWDELLMLLDRSRTGRPVPPLHYLSHPRVMAHEKGVLKIREKGGRSVYLEGVGKLGGTLWPWKDEIQLETATAACGAWLRGPDRPRPSNVPSNPVITRKRKPVRQ
jgi:hypothetical protein